MGPFAGVPETFLHPLLTELFLISREIREGSHRRSLGSVRLCVRQEEGGASSSTSPGIGLR